MALLVGVVVAWGLYQFNSIDRVDVNLQAAEDLAPRNFLLVGSDTRDLGADKNSADAGGIYGNGSDVPPSGKRADTIVIARVDPKKATIELLSVPRDLWVKSSTGGSQRINSAYNSGPQELIDSIKRNLGIPINNYVEVDFNGFKGLVEALRGVPLYFDRPVRDRNTGLNIKKAGCYTLDGVQALAFARSRHLVYLDGAKWRSDGSGDLGRITRQQIFLRHALAKVTTLGLDDVNSLRVLATVAVDNVKVDKSLGISDMISLARHFSKFDASQLVVHRLSTSPTKTRAGADVLTVSKVDSQPVIDIFTGKAKATAVSVPPTTALAPAGVTVDVKNGAGVALLAKTVSNRLASLGFPAGELGNLDVTERPKVTTVAYGSGAEAKAQLLASKLSPMPPTQADPNLAAGRVELRLMSEPNIPGSSTAGAAAGATPAPSAAAGAGNAASPSTTAPSTGAGTATPEKPVGVTIGDPPPGVSCG